MASQLVSKKVKARTVLPARKLTGNIFWDVNRCTLVNFFTALTMMLPEGIYDF
jgi:hypothetical protein